MDRPGFLGIYISFFINGLAQYVEHTAQRRFSDRRFDGVSGGKHFIAAPDSFTRGEHNTAHGVTADMLCNLHHARLSVRCNGQGFVDLRQTAALKSDIYDRAGHLHYGTFAFHSSFLTFYARLPSARKRTVRVGIGRRGCGVSAPLSCVPPTISVISCVMADCRARL